MRNCTIKDLKDLEYKAMLIGVALTLIALIPTISSATAITIGTAGTKGISYTINGSPFSVTYLGSGDPSLGTLDATLKYNDTVPSEWAKWSQIITIVTFWNPAFSREINGGINLLSLTNGNYTIDRTISYLNPFGTPIATISAALAGVHTSDPMKELQGSGTMTGNGDFSGYIDLLSIQPFTETLVPAGPGRIEGDMEIPYVTKGGIVLGKMHTTYFFDPSVTLPFPELRNIEVSYSSVDDLTVEVHYSNLTVQPVPEPNSLFLMLGAGVGLAGARYLRRRSRLDNGQDRGVSR